MRIIIAGDIVPTKINKHYFNDNLLAEKIGKEFTDIWFNSDYRIFNLECPICENIEPISKYGICLQCDYQSFLGVQSLKPNLVLLSNNHILDYNIDGLKSTLQVLDKNKIPYTGIIDNCNSQNKGFIFSKEGMNVGIYNICDNEFSIASKDKMGASGINYLKNSIEIKNLKEKCDYVVVVYHGGKEFYQYPTPNLKEKCEFYATIGADIVICQHSHCIGCMEKYNESTIIYGQGNFIFDDGDNEIEQNSLVLDVNFSKENYSINYIPIEKNNGLIKVSNNKNILKNFKKRSIECSDNNLLYSNLTKLADNKLNGYMSIMSKKNIFTKILNKFHKNTYYIKKYSKQDLLKILNIVECSAHREVLISGLKNEIERRK